MVKTSLLSLLRCPACAPQSSTGTDAGRLSLVAEGYWLVCEDCGRKYPIVEDIPVMLIETGDQWRATPIERLPVPPPASRG